MKGELVGGESWGSLLLFNLSIAPKITNELKNINTLRT